MPEQAENNTNKHEKTAGEGCLESSVSLAFDIVLVVVGGLILVGLESLSGMPFLGWLAESNVFITAIVVFFWLFALRLLMQWFLRKHINKRK